MQRRLLSITLPVAALAVPLLYASAAHAGVGACGDIHVEASAECELKAGIECEAQCEPVNLTAQCAAELKVTCENEGGCNLGVEAECSGSCMADCSAECEISPAQFDCKAECFAQAEAEAEGRCSTGDNECFASAQATAEAECSASCDFEPGELDCESACEASCEGSCIAQANFDCQIECQNDSYAECQAELEGGCRAECETEDGGLFCDGQYVDHGGNLEECVNSLRALLNIEVSGYARCGNGKCEAGGSASFSCAVDESGRTMGALWMAGLFGLLPFLRRRNT